MGLAATAAPAAPVEPEVDPVFAQAIFDKGGALAICVDIDVRGKRAADAGPWTASARQRLIDRMNQEDAGTAPKGMTNAAVGDSCERAFPDRLVLASCKPSNGDGTVLYYSFDLLKNDVEMRDCLKVLHGDWQALRRDSDEYRHAKARYDAERAIDLAGRLTQ